ncbi:MAG: hypothetical protein Q9182_007192 [Xanthomendoza sp. 2 TL-2023]
MTNSKKTNSELSTLVAQAKKSGLPKDIIERAIAKGKGVSLSGEPLQTLILEAMLPPSVSTIIECQTDNKKRTFEDLRLLVKEAGGTVTPTSHLFERRGHIILNSDRELEEDRVLEQVLEAGALDMEVKADRKSLSVYTEPNETASIARSLSTSLALRLGSYEIIWVARPDFIVEVKDEEDRTRTALEEIINAPMPPDVVHRSSPNATRRNLLSMVSIPPTHIIGAEVIHPADGEQDVHSELEFKLALAGGRVFVGAGEVGGRVSEG